MTPLQKQIYKIIVSRNKEYLETVVANRRKKLAASHAKAAERAAAAVAEQALKDTVVDAVEEERVDGPPPFEAKQDGELAGPKVDGDKVEAEEHVVVDV